MFEIDVLRWIDANPLSRCYLTFKKRWKKLHPMYCLECGSQPAASKNKTKHTSFQTEAYWSVPRKIVQKSKKNKKQFLTIFNPDASYRSSLVCLYIFFLFCSGAFFSLHSNQRLCDTGNQTISKLSIKTTSSFFIFLLTLLRMKPRRCNGILFFQVHFHNQFLNQVIISHENKNPIFPNLCHSAAAFYFHSIWKF